tara:strand:- start:9102 stop:9509 length:408 start_codon:yes stop_codon:yes gene_type:complete
LSLVQWIEFRKLGDERGALVAIESCKTIPFKILRTYYIYDTQPGVARGFHAHKELKQVAVCVSGRCRMKLDSGKDVAFAWLDSPTKAIRIDEMVWHEMDEFSPDCVMLVLASDHYDEADYIRDYQEFLEAVKNEP